MKSPAVSVIVPVFNVADYVVQCLDSLLSQDLKNLEIIVVNDGSNDGTAQIVEQYAEEHYAIRLISQENQGLSAARNTGLLHAKGEYIGFVDGDDWVDGSMYQTLYCEALASKADIVITNGQLYEQDTGNLRPIQDFRIWESLRAKNSDLSFSVKSEPDLFLLDTSVCKRFYKRAFLEKQNFRFLRGKIFEDIPSHFYLLLNADVVSLVDEKFYFYRTKRPGRITAKKDKSLFQIFDVMEQVINDLYSYNASDAIWANYIWFQHWVLRWLGNQIDSQYASEFNQRVKKIAKTFKQSGVLEFQSKFRSDTRASSYVAEQLTAKMPIAFLSDL